MSERIIFIDGDFNDSYESRVRRSTGKKEIKEKIMEWISVKDRLPDVNMGVLVFIPDEDNHITSGMWDVGKEWVLLDEYRVPECEVTHWLPLPKPPKQ